MSVGIDQLRKLEFFFTEAMSQLQRNSDSPDRELERHFSLVEVAELLDKSTSYISKKRNEMLETGKLTPFSADEERKKQKGYTLSQVNEFRKEFSALPYRDPGIDPCVKIAVQHFKGGVGKTSTAVGLAQYLATRGYRVLLIDMDFQGSTTCAFGYIPDIDISQEETIVPYYLGEKSSLDYCIRSTHWPQLELIPANMSLHNLEFAMARDLMESNHSDRDILLKEFAEGIATVEDRYDVVILDSPPHAGLVALNILYAANALIIPTPPSMYDFASTKQFLRIVIEQFEVIDEKHEYEFVKFLGTKVMTNRSSQEDILDIMRAVVGDNMFKELFYHTAELEKASLDFRTVYEDRKPQSRARTIMDNVFGEVEREIIQCWPSRTQSLTETRRVYA